jgi:protein-tyrosine phosphatase
MLFLALADRRNLPGVFHCTTGKDRTGWAAAALLTLLGVPKETVMADFLRSNEYVIPQFQRAIDDFVDVGGDRAIPLAVFGVNAKYLEASFHEMQKGSQTIENYFSKALGINAAGQKGLRDPYTEKN